MVEVAPHDLIKLTPFAVKRLMHGAPGWVVEVIVSTPWVVVRRARPSGDGIPCGIRGRGRNLRFQCDVRPGETIRSLRPEDLVHAQPRRPLPAFRAFVEFRERAQREGLVWGPTGSVGFEFASGQQTVDERSDCDIVLRGATLTKPQLVELARSIEDDPRFDIEVDFGEYAIALREIASAPESVMAKTPDGPKLIAWPSIN